ncbi:unnamed protein product [Ranitomeya imitator]|uniref:Helix-turn-helix domain-containing protein n=1 Tax=Ranitomeya imitator TaxID=111125 RepID=A0ABN9KXS4_9NEOB|nr:unnamed protein product [Ranitomeya imitator]
MDSTSALQRLDNMYLADNMMMVTADMESLHTSIRHRDGLAAASWYLKMSNLDARLVDLLVFKGLRWGLPVRPRMQICSWAHGKGRFLSSNPVQGTENIHHWMRYIDDVWFIWEGSRQDQDSLMTKLNQNNLNIKFTYKVGRELDFLDIQIKTSSCGNRTTEVFRKRTATKGPFTFSDAAAIPTTIRIAAASLFGRWRAVTQTALQRPTMPVTRVNIGYLNTLLHVTSSHPISTIISIPMGQFLRIKHICLNSYIFDQQARDLRRRFGDRGYSKKITRDGYHRAKHILRKELLYKNKPKDKGEESNVCLIATYKSQWTEFRDIIKKHWPILLSDSTLNKCLPSTPLITARRSKT